MIWCSMEPGSTTSKPRLSEVANCIILFRPQLPEPREDLPDLRYGPVLELLPLRFVKTKRIQDLLPTHELVVKMRRRASSGIARVSDHLSSLHSRTDRQPLCDRAQMEEISTVSSLGVAELETHAVSAHGPVLPLDHPVE